MALPTVADLKSYLRIESPAENALLAQLLARAQAMLETWIDVPIAAEQQTAVDRAECLGTECRSLVFPRRPIANVAVVDAESTTLATSDYTVDGNSGIIYANALAFAAGPYTITADVGLSLRQDWLRLEPVIGGMIIDLASDLYQRRTPGAASETAAGTTITWDASRETVARIMKSLRALRLGVAQ